MLIKWARLKVAWSFFCHLVLSDCFESALADCKCRFICVEHMKSFFFVISHMIWGLLPCVVALTLLCQLSFLLCWCAISSMRWKLVTASALVSSSSFRNYFQRDFSSYIGDLMLLNNSQRKAPLRNLVDLFPFCHSQFKTLVVKISADE